MKRNYLISILLLLLVMPVLGQEKNCHDFKNGKFMIVDTERGNSIIERQGKTQIEYGEASKLKLEFKVKWINDCTYTLKLKKVHENPKQLVFNKDMILTVEIIKTTENSYVQKSSSNLYDMVVESELIRIE